MKRFVCTLAAVVLLTGCGSQPTPVTGDSPDPIAASPSFAPGPAAPSTPSAGPLTDPERDPLYREAVQIYRAYFKEMQKVEASGYSSPEWPKAMDQYVTGPMKEGVAQGLAGSYELDVRPMSGQSSRLIAVAPHPGAQRRGSLIGIRTCADARDVTIVRREDAKPVGYGPLLYKEIYFKQFSGDLKAFTQIAKEVDECPIG